MEGRDVAASCSQEAAVWVVRQRPYAVNAMSG